MFKKLKNKIDNHFIKLANVTLDNNLSLVNQKINDINVKLDVNNKKNNVIDNRFSSINTDLIKVSNDLLAVKNHLELVNNNLTNIISDTKKHIDVDVSTYVKAAIVHQKTFTQFKDYCKGKKLVICAAGPSLNKYHPIEDAVHIALNRSILFDKVHFDFLFVQDFAGIKMITNEILDYKNCIKLFAHPFPENFEHWAQITPPIPESFARECDALRFYLNNHIYGGYHNSPFIKDIDTEPLAGHGAVGLSVLQFALYMNPTDIYLVGYDVSGSHFTHKNQTEDEIHDDEKKSEDYWKNEHENQIKKFKEFKEFKDRFYPNIRIHSINPVGLKGIFADIFQ